MKRIGFFGGAKSIFYECAKAEVEKNGGRIVARNHHAFNERELESFDGVIIQPDIINEDAIRDAHERAGIPVVANDWFDLTRGEGDGNSAKTTPETTTAEDTPSAVDHARAYDPPSAGRSRRGGGLR